MLKVPGGSTCPVALNNESRGLRWSGLDVLKPWARRPSMLADRRFGIRFLEVFALAASLSLSLPLAAQVPSMEFHGIPPSGIGGSLTTFSASRPNYAGAYGGAAAFGCCASFFFPSSFSPLVPYPTVRTEHRTHHRHHQDNSELVGVYEPVYVPYAVPYPVDSEDDVADDPDEAGPAEGQNIERGRYAADGSRTRRRPAAANEFTGVPEQGAEDASADSGDVRDATADAAPAMPADPPEPVVAQPSTVLVYKDGHRSKVMNYAIVGDTLFDFSGDRTHKILLADLDIPATQKANDAAGVEFKLPPTGANRGGAK
jgi:hypothetical protein